VEIEFDPAKDAGNIAKHRISLARASDIDVLKAVRVERHGEARLKVMGLIDGKLYALVLVFRPNVLRAISLRPARPEELNDA
jgi:uncharacterized DUF497 family protein